MKIYNGPGDGRSGNRKMKGGPGKGGKDASKANPDMYGHEGLSGAYGEGKRTTEDSYGKSGYDRKGFYW